MIKGFASRKSTSADANPLIIRVRPGRTGRGWGHVRAYAATLLARLDPAAGRAGWLALAEDPGEFTTFSGCVMGRATLREYATERLAE